MRGPRFIATLLLALAAIACQANEPSVRKAIDSGICHDPSSPNYKQIKIYMPYATMAACVASGGKPRKGSAEPAAPPARKPGLVLYDSDDPTIVKKSRNDICYDSSNGRFEEIIHYTAYRDMEDCVADGGRDAAH
jgi:hypothetical protein